MDVLPYLLLLSVLTFATRAGAAPSKDGKCFYFINFLNFLSITIILSNFYLLDSVYSVVGS